MTRRSGGAFPAGGTPLCLQPWKISTSPGGDLGEAMPVAGVLTIPPPGAEQSMLVRHLAPFLLDLTLPETIDTTRLPRVADVTGDRTAVVIASPPSVQIDTWGSGAHTCSSRECFASTRPHRHRLSPYPRVDRRTGFTPARPIPRPSRAMVPG